jgi:hypothetical protein
MEVASSVSRSTIFVGDYISVHIREGGNITLPRFFKFPKWDV